MTWYPCLSSLVVIALGSADWLVAVLEESKGYHSSSVFEAFAVSDVGTDSDSKQDHIHLT